MVQRYATWKKCQHEVVAAFSQQTRAAGVEDWVSVNAQDQGIAIKFASSGVYEGHNYRELGAIMLLTPQLSGLVQVMRDGFCPSSIGKENSRELTTFVVIEPDEVVQYAPMLLADFMEWSLTTSPVMDEPNAKAWATQRAVRPRLAT